MAVQGSVVVIGGTGGLGLAVAQHYADEGRDVVISGRDAARAEAVAKEIGGNTTGIGLDLAEVDQIEDRLSGVGDVAHLALVAMERAQASVKEYDAQQAARLVTVKLVGYTEVVRVLSSRMGPGSSAVLFGGSAQARPYPGSTVVTTANGGIASLVRTLAVELAPIRFNAIHPMPVGDNPFWQDKPQEVREALGSRTPIGRMVNTAEVVDAVDFLFRNTGVNGTNLDVNGGFLLT
jgi:NAD(P)-dependent dehydrogenase (short-subunit alcohol dehydrogenase family)